MQSLLFHSLVNNNSLPSGYNRDAQLGKKPLMEGLELAIECVKIASYVISKIKVNKEKSESAISEEMFSAEKALGLAKKGMPFREAYNAIAKTTTNKSTLIQKCINAQANYYKEKKNQANAKPKA